MVANGNGFIMLKPTSVVRSPKYSLILFKSNSV